MGGIAVAGGEGGEDRVVTSRLTISCSLTHHGEAVLVPVSVLFGGQPGRPDLTIGQVCTYKLCRM